ncbi:helix-turn-helix domain-containing protein [Streptomyces sp. ISL-43]|uniref:helix-turn-helix domain-containing protein n=1 Tax=Streptomyces sp. ISL-43 TaxID=2819183 RepID=UPI001BECA871|nr:helix-turn-helix domain-containing protein [Streptomyces sp. ISL-43]MBT2450932.1 helix-turn-helix domain-containing protein [Streptomyces sp. ISL-43]
MTTQPEGFGRLVRPDGAVLVPAAVAGEVLRALVRDLTARVRADGGEVSPAVRRLLYALHAADEQHQQASSAAGTPAVAPATVELTAQQAAALLECSPEYARRLARSGRLRARRAGPVWLVDAASLEAYRKGDAA